MDKFSTNALSLMKQVVFQQKPFLLLTIEPDELNASYRGDENALIDAIVKAMEHDKNIAAIIRRSAKKHERRMLEPTSQKIAV